MLDKLWVEKYRPKKVKGIVGNEQLKSIFEEYIEKQEIPNIMLYGSPGTGKTTIAKILIKNIDCEYLYINGSDDNGIDVMRNKIGTFGSSVSFKKFKIVLIDEADFITLSSQSVLRNIIETFYDNTRFIFTCNYPNKIIDALHSRFQSFEIKPPSTEGLENRAKLILDKESIKYSEQDISDIVKNCYPDVRKLINMLQQYSKEGEFKIQKGSVIGDTYKSDLLKAIKNNKPFEEIRQIIVNASSLDYNILYQLLFEDIDKYISKKGTEKEIEDREGEIRISIAEYMYRDSFVVNKEINLSACINKILKLNK